MTNWVTNHLQIRSSAENILKVKTTLKSEDFKLFDFNTLVPMPSSFQSNPDKYVFWAKTNWGTASNAMSCTETEDTISFLTPNSAPIILLEHLAQKFPHIEFRFRFADEDFGNNFGEIVFEGTHKFIMSPRPKAYSKDAISWSVMLEGNHEWSESERIQASKQYA